MRDYVSPIFGAFRRPISPWAPHMQWLRVPWSTKLPLSASERQSGWVLGDAAPELRVLLRKHTINLPHDPLGPLDRSGDQRFGPDVCDIRGGIAQSAAEVHALASRHPYQALRTSSGTRADQIGRASCRDRV